jgi:aminoglycoside phosphotransferase (APT) family kinase protein
VPLLTDADVLPWVEKTLGRRIASFSRQAGRESGGRPGWFVTLDDGARYYVRGSRGTDFGYTRLYGLQREARVLRVLHAEGIPVPRVVATSECPDVVVMEHVDGVNDFTQLASREERDRVAADFAAVMARWHAIPPEKFAEVGVALPREPEDFIVRDLEVWEAGHFPLLREPVPLVTFACRWLRRNLPEPPERTVLVQGDTGPGQFIFSGGKVRAVVDWELANLGDPMRDLAHVRARDVWYPTGNLMHWFESYAALSGTPLDLDRVRYYTVIAMLTTALALGPVVQNMDPRDEHAEWFAQDVWSKKATAEALADALGLALEPCALPKTDSPRAAQIFDLLEENLREEQLAKLADPWQQHRLRMDLRLLAHARNLAEIGAEVEAQELADQASLLGRRPASLREGHRLLNELVLRAGPELDEAFVRHFHRHALREEALMRGAMGRAEGAAATPLG